MSMIPGPRRPIQRITDPLIVEPVLVMDEQDYPPLDVAGLAPDRAAYLQYADERYRYARPRGRKAIQWAIDAADNQMGGSLVLRARCEGKTGRSHTEVLFFTEGLDATIS